MFAHQLAAALGRAGCAVVRLYLYPHPGAAALPLDPGDRVLGGKPGHPFERFPGLHPGLLGRLRRAIAEHRPDVVQAHGGRTVKYGAAARRLDRGAGWALVYRNIGDPRRWAAGPRGALYRRLVMPRIDGVVGVSEATLAAVRDHYALDGLPMEHLPRGADPAALSPGRPPAAVRAELGTPEGAPVLLYLGSLTPEKRLDRMLAWVAGARREHPGLRLWVVGEGPLRGDLERLAAERGLGGAVAFAGARERVGDFLAAADLLLLSSDTEGMPGAVIEAAAAGVPAVATAVGGVAECVEDGVTGLLVDPATGPAGDPTGEAAGAAAISALLADPARRRAMGEATRRRFAASWHIDAVAARYLAFYERVIAHRRSAR